MSGTSQRQRLREAQLANRRAARLRRIVLIGSAILAMALVAVLVVLLVQRFQ